MGGFLPPELSPKPSKTVEFGLLILRSARWGLGVGHRLQPLRPYGLVGSGGGLGDGLNGDRGRGVPRPRVGLAGNGGGFWGVDDGVLGDRDVDEGLNRVVSGGRRRAGGARWGEGGLECGGWGVLACVGVRVWVTAGSLVLLSHLLWFLGLCGVSLVLLLVVVVVLVRLGGLVGFRFWFGVGLWVGFRFEVEENLVPEVRGHQCWVGGVRGDLVAPRADLVGSGGRGRRGAAVSSFWAWLGWGPAMREGVWVGVRGGEQFECAAFGGRGGWACGSGGVCGGSVRVTGPGGCAVGRGVPCGGCVRFAGWGVGGEGQGRALRGGLCYVGVCVRLHRRACVVSCRPGGGEACRLLRPRQGFCR